MEEKEEKTETEQPEETPQDSTINMIERSERVVADLKTENDRRESIIQKEQVMRTLSGNAEAGIPSEEKKGMTNKEYTEYVEKHGRAPDEA